MQHLKSVPIWYAYCTCALSQPHLEKDCNIFGTIFKKKKSKRKTCKWHEVNNCYLIHILIRFILLYGIELEININFTDSSLSSQFPLRSSWNSLNQSLV